MDKINTLILGILSFQTLFWILSKTGWIPRTIPVLSRLIYGENDTVIIKSILKELGVPVEEIREKISKKKQRGTSQITEQVISVCVNSILYAEAPREYGKKYSSQYYINTMEAMHDSGYRDIMIAAIIQLFRKTPDFIITPKSGNTYLAFEVAKKLGNTVPCVVVKSESDAAVWKSAGNQSAMTRFEGVEALRHFVKDRQGRKLYGVAVDCNRVRCTTLETAIKTFNEEVVSEYPDTIETVTDAVILYRPITTADYDIDSRDDLHIDRYFDLDEEIKRMMWEIKAKANGQQVFCENKNDLKQLAVLRGKLEEKGFLKRRMK